MSNAPLNPIITRKEVIKQGAQFVLILVLFFLLAHTIGLERIQGYLGRVGIWGPVILIALKASTIIFAPLGGSPLYPLAGALYGFWPGFIYMIVGDIVGFGVSFYLSRIFGQPILRYFLGSDTTLITTVLRYLGTKQGLLRARLFFLGFPEAVSYAAGLTTISFLPFIAIQIGVSLVPVALLVGFGTVLIERLSPVLLLLGSAIIAGVALLGIWWFYQVARKHGQTPQHETED